MFFMKVGDFEASSEKLHHREIRQHKLKLNICRTEKEIKKTFMS